MDMKLLGWFVYFVFCGAEMQAMTTIFGLKNMSKYRQAAADVLFSPESKMHCNPEASNWSVSRQS